MFFSLTGSDERNVLTTQVEIRNYSLLAEKNATNAVKEMLADVGPSTDKCTELKQGDLRSFVGDVSESIPSLLK